MRQIMRTLIREERGAVLIELALVAPVFITMVVGVVDITNAYNQKLALEQGAQRAIEKMQQTSQDKTVDQSVKDEVVCQVNGMTTTNGVETCKSGLITAEDVTVTDRLECLDAAGTAVHVYTGADAVEDCAGGETETRYVSVAVNSVYTPMFPLHFGTYDSAKGGYVINVTAGVRTK